MRYHVSIDDGCPLAEWVKVEVKVDAAQTEPTFFGQLIVFLYFRCQV
jgi:hypothetical protein